MKGFDVLALDKDFNIIAIVDFILLQWSRKWHESGTFSMSIPLNEYSNDWEYIYTSERPEIGKISQINYIEQNGMKTIILSGYFLEKELDRMIVYPKQRYVDERNDPTYTSRPSLSDISVEYMDVNHYEGNADVVAHKFFNAFKQISFFNNTAYPGDNKYFELGITDGTTENGQYKYSDHYRNGETLGYKIYDILKPSGASYRVRLDFENTKKYFDVLAGKDKTEENTAGNNPIIFSTQYGNIIRPNIVFDKTNKKDAIISASKYQSSTSDKTTEYYAVNVTCADDCAGDFVFIDSSINPSEYKYYDLEDGIIGGGKDSNFNTEAFKEDTHKEHRSEIQKQNVQLINIEFEASAGSYEYIEDFDIGDLVSLEIQEIGLSANVRLIGCYEVIQNGKWKLSMEFGTPIIK